MTSAKQRSEYLGITAVGSHGHHVGRNPQQACALLGYLVALGRHCVYPTEELMPERDLDAPSHRSAIGSDGVVGEWTLLPHHGRHQVLERLTSVGDHADRVQLGQSGSKPRNGTPVVADTGLVSVGDTECEVGLDLGWAVEQAQHPVGPQSGGVELVGQSARLALRPPGQRRGDDMQDERLICLRPLVGHIGPLCRRPAKWIERSSAGSHHRG